MQRVDPTFGLMKFGRSFGFFGKGSWSGETNFHPVGKRIKVYVTAGRNGVSDAQRDFFGEIQRRYPVLVEDIRDVVVDAPLNYFGPKFFGQLVPALDWKDFELDSISILEIKRDDPIKWSLSYRYVPMTESYSVYFEDWKPVEEGKLDD